MLCYRCHSKMKKQEFDGVLIDRCENCKSVWLDGGELEMLIYGEKMERKELVTEAKKEMIVESKKQVITPTMCPRCQMAPLTIIHQKGVELDQCSYCQGIFFDWGELNQVLSKEKSDKLNSFKGWLHSIFKK